jgi:hypothetical protein
MVDKYPLMPVEMRMHFRDLHATEAMLNPIRESFRLEYPQLKHKFLNIGNGFLRVWLECAQTDNSVANPELP